MKVKHFDRGQVLKKNKFSVILKGMCDLRSLKGGHLKFLGRGDCFGEESFKNGVKGYASYGMIQTRDSVELAVLDPQYYYAIPRFEIDKILDHVRNIIAQSEFNTNSKTVL